MFTRKIAVWFILLALVGLSCKMAEQATVTQPATPTASSAQTQPVLVNTDTPQPTQDTLAGTQTADAAAQSAQQTQSAQDSAATQTQAASTQSAVQTSTAQVGNQGTEQARTMAVVIQKLANDGAVGATTGNYYRLPDFDQSEARLGYLRGWYTDYEAQNFVLSANTAWNSASTSANWPDSGCGVIFSLTDDANYYYSYLGLDGYVRLGRITNGEAKLQAQDRYGKVSIPDGEAKIMLVVYGQRVKYYVNDQPVMDTYAAAIKPGPIAMTLLSGTNKDYGTRCQMTDVDLWIFE